MFVFIARRWPRWPGCLWPPVCMCGGAPFPGPGMFVDDCRLRCCGGCRSAVASGDVGPESLRAADGLLFVSAGVAAADVAVDRGGVDLVSSACFLAFSLISRCLTSSLARIGRRSAGTSVVNLKFWANFLRSFSLTALSRRAKLRCCSCTRSFSDLLNSRNAAWTSFSTVAVAPPSLLAARGVGGIAAGTVGFTA